MSCRAFHNVLVLLDDDAASMWNVLDHAIELAEAERARLTIAKTTDPGWIVRWFGPLATLSRCGPVIEPCTDAQCSALDRASAYVPPHLPLTRVLLGSDTVRALRQLAEQSNYDLLVVRDSLLAHNRALRREARRLGLCTLAVCSAGRDPEAVLTP
jgi:nucleotide-binding universal stress UspA family protein